MLRSPNLRTHDFSKRRLDFLPGEKIVDIWKERRLVLGSEVQEAHIFLVRFDNCSKKVDVR